MNRFTRTMTAAASALALMVGGFIATAAPAAADDTPRYVSKAEFRKVRKGMAIKRVHRIFDVRGKQTWYSPGYSGPYGWPAEQSREYRVKSKWGSVDITFKRKSGTWRLSSKSAYWG